MITPIKQKTAAWRHLRARVEPQDPPHHVANLVLRHFAIVRPPVDVFAIAQAMGVRVDRARRLPEVGSVDPTVDPPRIQIRAEDAEVRQRFTVAHELGHLLMHELTKHWRDERYDGPRDPKEVAANRFAASLLVPLWFLEGYLVTGDAEQALVNRFRVSKEALRYQIERLRG